MTSKYSDAFLLMLVVTSITLIICMASFWKNPITSGPSKLTREHAQANAICYSIVAYYAEIGDVPKNDKNLSRLLLGDNKKKITFLAEGTVPVNAEGFFIDSDGKPYEIIIDLHKVTVRGLDGKVVATQELLNKNN